MAPRRSTVQQLESTTSTSSNTAADPNKGMSPDVSKVEALQENMALICCQSDVEGGVDILHSSKHREMTELRNEGSLDVEEADSIWQ